MGKGGGQTWSLDHYSFLCTYTIKLMLLNEPGAWFAIGEGCPVHRVHSYSQRISMPFERLLPKVIDLGGANVQAFAYVRVAPAEIDTATWITLYLVENVPAWQNQHCVVQIALLVPPFKFFQDSHIMIPWKWLVLYSCYWISFFKMETKSSSAVVIRF